MEISVLRGVGWVPEKSADFGAKSFGIWDHQKKIAFVENYKVSAICAILREKPHFGAFPEAKKGVARTQVR